MTKSIKTFIIQTTLRPAQRQCSIGLASLLPESQGLRFSLYDVTNEGVVNG